MPYSAASDLLLGDIPLSAALDRTKFVVDAADEIDSYIGSRYVTPIDTSANTQVVRHSVLLLKRLNNFLATGRLILAIDAGGEDTALHAYGARLVNESLRALREIADGSVDIEGAVLHDPSYVGDPGPAIVNYDKTSAVDAFYSRVMVPDDGPLPYLDWTPGSS